MITFALVDEYHASAGCDHDTNNVQIWLTRGTNFFDAQNTELLFKENVYSEQT